MLNTPTDSKLNKNPLKVSPYFNDYQLKVNVTPPTSSALLQENGFYILQENGDKILLE